MKERRTLLLGASGFLGSAVRRALPENATLFLRRDSAIEGYSSRQIIVHGLIEDTLRLKQIIALHEIDCIIHCAAGQAASETHQLTDCVLRAAAGSERRPRVIVPLRANAAVRFHTEAPARLAVSFVKLPDLFGINNRNYLHGPGALFAQAALGLPLPMLPRDRGVCAVDDAAAAIVSMIDSESTNTTGEWIEAPATATGRELHAAVRAELESPLTLLTPLSLAVRETLAWYRGQADRWRSMMPANLRIAA